MSDDEEVTPFGFRWGPMAVTRLAFFEPRKGAEERVLRMTTPRDEIEIYVSRTGCIRVWRKGKHYGEMKVAEGSGQKREAT